ncbi:MAG: tRNA (adenosine(37)-N6)-threonylcarbamoyltransferase complex ATPase subunit type 1 TsaE [Sphingobacteriales bacterium]|nr:MAG: tRNA (adenosine(37)-N6)-threonylcarbamoyltransferase complex ATPase subunit type 1 TsaE [Sphingobacteriales bacterium]
MREAVLQISYSLGNIDDHIDQLWQYMHHHRILAFHGQMGAGKTTLIHHICSYLGVEDAVSSPTFALVNEYHFQQRGQDQVIYHMDWYRIRSVPEAIDAGIEDLLSQPDGYCFIEWPVNAADLLPLPHLSIEIEAVSETERNLTLFLQS